MGVIRHSDGVEETVAVKKLKNSMAMNNPESVDLQRECAIMKVRLVCDNSVVFLVIIYSFYRASVIRTLWKSKLLLPNRPQCW